MSLILALEVLPHIIQISFIGVPHYSVSWMKLPVKRPALTTGEVLRNWCPIHTIYSSCNARNDTPLNLPCPGNIPPKAQYENQSGSRYIPDQVNFITSHPANVHCQKGDNHCCKNRRHDQ
jgi:hypothetical protein